MVNVLHIEAGKHLYGGALQVKYLTNGLGKYGIKSFLAAPINSEIFDVIDKGVVKVPMDMKGDLDFGMFYRVRKLILNNDIKLVHIHSRRGADLFGLLAARSLNVPVIISRRVDNTEPKWFARWKYSKASHVITISEQIKRVLTTEGVASEHVSTVLSAVDTDKYTPKQDKEWFCNEFPKNIGKFNLAIVAQMISRKGHEVAFEAVNHLKEKYPNINLMVFGRGPLQEKLRLYTKHNDLCQFVGFEGFRTDLEKILPNIDCLIHPAFKEGLGVALLQSNSCGVPIIAANAGGMPEAVEHGYNGWLFSPGNSEQLASHIENIINKSDLKLMKKNARALAEQRFSIDSMVEGNFLVYQKVLES